ncbi:hypothetical protein Bca52824_062349 [Brassica carinata]|uniref:Uncharacterized protein n=1 Tax=Brassica carinata TaxID=52824 RepID=A0A8X7U776_BRACI|nr:hypothetical protein Bca52824_062349 [Brassica carinata]
MEGSVIGNSQAKICRSELTRRELGFRFGSDVISGESINRVSSKWISEIRQMRSHRLPNKLRF